MFDYVFQVRPFWDEMNVPKQKVERRYQKFFGKENLTIENRQEATSLLLRVVTELQNEILKYLKNSNPKATAKMLYKILNDTYSLYMKERSAR